MSASIHDTTKSSSGEGVESRRRRQTTSPTSAPGNSSWIRRRSSLLMPYPRADDVPDKVKSHLYRISPAQNSSALVLLIAATAR